MSSYLVLGGEGFIGKHLVKFLEKTGANVDVIDIKLDPKHDLRFLEIERLQSYNYCFFLAWDVGGSKYLNNKSTWNKQFKNNLALLSNVIPQLELCNIPFLFVSSQLAGSDLSPYSLSKLYGENYCKTIPTCGIARQWNAYGIQETTGEKSHVINDMIHQALSKKRIELLTDGSEMRKFIHLDDICEAYMQIITVSNGQVFDVAAGEYVSILEVAKIISKLTGAEVIPGNVKGISPKVREISSCPNWQPKIELEEGIINMLDIYERN